MPQESNSPFSDQEQDSILAPSPDLDDVDDATGDPFESRVRDFEVKQLDDETVEEPDEIKPSQESFSDVEKDKWALSDEDRMTNEEMNKELFGDG